MPQKPYSRVTFCDFPQYHIPFLRRKNPQKILRARATDKKSYKKAIKSICRPLILTDNNNKIILKRKMLAAEGSGDASTVKHDAATIVPIEKLLETERLVWCFV